MSNSNFVSFPVLISVFDKGMAQKNAKLTFKSNNKEIFLLDENFDKKTETDKDGLLYGYLLKSEIGFPLTISAEISNSRFKSVVKNEVDFKDDMMNSVTINFGLEQGSVARTVFGTFKECPFDSIITKVSGKIVLKFKSNNKEHSLEISSNKLLKNKFSNLGKIDELNLEWKGLFDNGSFIFNIVSPDIKMTECKVTIYHNNGLFTHDINFPAAYTKNYSFPKSDTFELSSDQKLTIPYYHDLKDLEFAVNVYNVGKNEVVKKSKYNMTVLFNHCFIDALGDEQEIAHEFFVPSSLPGKSETNEAADPKRSPRDAIKIDYIHNNGDYLFSFSNVCGNMSTETNYSIIRDLEIKIKYGAQTISHKKNNGNPKGSVEFTMAGDNITKNVLNKKHILVPINGWSGTFELMPARDAKDSITQILFENEPIWGLNFNAPGKHDFTKMDFIIKKSSPLLKYDDSTSNIGFVMNLFVSDKDFNPVKVRLSFGKYKNSRMIHSIDFNNNITLPQQFIPQIFFPKSMDPLPSSIKVTEPLSNIISLQGKDSTAHIETSLDFVDSSGKELPYGIYYVLAQVLPVHYKKNGQNAEVDSVGEPKEALFKIDTTP